MILTKRSVAKSQLDTAILLWFQEADPVPILGLAAAANHCYVALGAHEGHESVFYTWFKQQSKTQQPIIREAINFIKHGRMNLKGKIPFPKGLHEVLIVDSIEMSSPIICGDNVSYERVYGGLFC